jgi:hypothetical protein
MEPAQQPQPHQPPAASPPPPTVACVALIGAQNQPLLLHIRKADNQEDAAEASKSRLRLSYVAHCALDALEEKVLLARRAAAAEGTGGAFLSSASPPDAYLGLLYPTEEYRVYGYCSATHLKVVLVVEPAAAVAVAATATSSPWPRDAALAALCRRLHAVYVDAASNPFFVPGAPLEDDARVLKGVDAALGEFYGAAAAAAG